MFKRKKAPAMEVIAYFDPMEQVHWLQAIKACQEKRDALFEELEQTGLLGMDCPRQHTLDAYGRELLRLQLAYERSKSSRAS